MLVYQRVSWDMGTLKTIVMHSGWRYTYPSEKDESVGMMKLPAEWKVIKKNMFETTNQCY